MILKIAILLILVLGGLVFLGVKMSENIKKQEVKILFFVLYAGSIFTLFNIGVSLYFFYALRNKRGKPGPKGKLGPMGDTGDEGKCDDKNCATKTLETLILDGLEGKITLKPFEKKYICQFVSNLYDESEGFSDKLKTNINKIIDNIDIISIYIYNYPYTANRVEGSNNFLKQISADGLLYQIGILFIEPAKISAILPGLKETSCS